MKLFIKNNIKFIIVIVICLIGSSITTLATNYIFNSNEVSYDNTESSLHADSVQGAIDEVFQHATDYSEIKNTIGTGSLTTTSNTLIGGVNELNGKITTVQHAYITAHQGTNVTITETYDSSCYRVGRIVTLQIGAKATGTINNDTIILDIPNGFRPTYKIRAVVNTTNGLAGVEIDESGYVKLRNAIGGLQSGETIIGCVSYIIV